jgi:hypothetical protein
MNEMKAYRFLPQTIELSEQGLPTKVQLFRTGAFYDERYGTVSITEKHLSEMVKNFTENVRGIDLAIDFSHKSEGPSAAWIKGLEVRNEGQELWAEVVWTEAGKTTLLNKEFRYLSPDFTFEYQDNESRKKFGAVLLGAGLTNRPVIKNMSPAVQLQEGQNMDKEYKELMEKKDKKIQELEEQIKELKDKKMGDKKMSEDAEKQVQELTAKNQELEKTVQEQNEKLALAEKNGEFDKMLSEGQVCEAQREAFIKGDMKAFASKYKEVRFSEGGHEQEKKEDETLNPQEKVLALAEEKAKTEKISLKDAITSVLKTDVKLAEAYNKGL